MGHAQRIVYVHVAVAWLGLLGSCAMGVSMRAFAQSETRVGSLVPVRRRGGLALRRPDPADGIFVACQAWARWSGIRG
jgi:hypothetical protein